jgi:hypothetical protein
MNRSADKQFYDIFYVVIKQNLIYLCNLEVTNSTAG